MGCVLVTLFRPHESDAKLSKTVREPPRVTAVSNAPVRKIAGRRTTRPQPTFVKTAKAPLPIDAGPVEVDWAAARENWQNEAPDPDWTENVISYTASLSTPEDGDQTIVDRADCRRSVCKLVIANANLEALQRLAGLARADGYSWTQEFVMEGDERRLVLYLSRDASGP
jgi:hypothetical protein